MVGARRLEHLRYVAQDPLLRRLCGLARVPSDRTVVNWLKQCTHAALQAMIALNSDVLYEQIERLGLSRLTLDIDGTVVRTGGTVAWAFRGFNPHHRKDASDDPLLAHVAQTGQILRVRNRPGNVHDSRGAVSFLRDVIRDLRRRFGRGLPLEFRMDAAFFQRDILTLLAREGCEYAIKVGFWDWVERKPLVAARCRWDRVTDDVRCFETRLPRTPWDLTLRVVVYRTHVRHQTRKNFPLDLFSRDDGHFEYSAVTTNKALSATALWAFTAGRGAQEKTLAELKANLRSMWCRRITMERTAPGNRGAYSGITYFAGSNSTRPRSRNRARPSAPTRMSCRACARSGFSCSIVAVASPAFTAGRCCA